MKPAVKAALISALIFPGLGHFVLKRGLRGGLFMAPAALACLYLLQAAIAAANALAVQIERIGLPAAMRLLDGRLSGAGGGAAGTLAAAVVALCWFGSVADALWIGRRR